VQGGADPMSRPESFADAAPVSNVEGKPPSQLEFAEAFRKIMPANVGRLKWTHCRGPQKWYPKHRKLIGTALVPKLIRRKPH
jgi:hypothetical protein